MNSVDLSGSARLVAGVRFESTHVDTRSFNNNTELQDFTAGGNYLDVLPSVAFKFAASPNTAVRLVYSRALSRPDPQDLAQAVGTVNDTQKPPTVSIGNPDLKAEHANNFDVLLEQYLSPLGLIQAGYFYKALSDPIIATQTRPTSGPFAGFLVSQPGNAGSATLQGFEIAYQQHLGFLPGALAGLGLSANYSYTTSEARGLPLRTDHADAAAAGAAHVEHQPDLRSRADVAPRRHQLQRREPLRLPVSEPEHRRHADGGRRSDRRRDDGPRRRQLSLRAPPARCAGQRPARRRGSRSWSTAST